MEVTIDFESRSPIDLKSCGAYIYWQHPKTQIMMLSVMIDKGETRVWIPPMFRGLYDTEIQDDELKCVMREANIVIAHNAAFERLGFKYGMTKLGFDEISLNKIRCTMSQVLMCAFPRNLELAAKYVLGGKEEKDKEGHNLMLKMSKPRAFNRSDAEPLVPELVERGYLNGYENWRRLKTLQTEFIKEYAVKGEGDEYLAEKFIIYREDIKDFERLVAYARQDVVVERMIYDTLPKIPDSELEIYRWSETVNDRGIKVNRPVVEAVRCKMEEHSQELLEEAVEITDGEVKSMRAPASIKKWLLKEGIQVDAIRKDDVLYLLSLDLPAKVRRFLEIRQKLGKSSLAKYDALLNYSSYDGRFRGGFVYHAATTGRYGGAGPQLQNLPRISEWNSTFVKGAAPEFCDAKLLVECDIDTVNMFWKDPMLLASDILRYMLWAEDGRVYISADYSAVEARGLAWIAEQDNVIQSFREGKDIYKVAASGIFKIPYEEVDGGGKGEQRRVGKTATLACLAEGTEVLTDSGWKEIENVKLTDKVWNGRKFASHQGVVDRGVKDIIRFGGLGLTRDHEVHDGMGWIPAENTLWDDYTASCVGIFGERAKCIAETIRGVTCGYNPAYSSVADLGEMMRTYDIAEVEGTHAFLARKGDYVIFSHNCGYGGGLGAFHRLGGDKLGLTDDECTAIVKAWREANPKITQLWKDLQRGSMKAMKYAGERIWVRRNVSFKKEGRFLTMTLPNGRNLYYPDAKVEECEMPWTDEDGNIVKKPMVTAHTLTAAKQWVRRPLSHVTLTENLVQALCRDLLMYSVKQLEKEGFPVVMHVHDEVVCEVPEGARTLEELETIMARIPNWAEGFPLVADGWVSRHYKK